MNRQCDQGHPSDIPATRRLSIAGQPPPGQFKTSSSSRPGCERNDTRHAKLCSLRSQVKQSHPDQQNADRQQ
jgi:hypothetical protein